MTKWLEVPVRFHLGETAYYAARNTDCLTCGSIPWVVKEGAVVAVTIRLPLDDGPEIVTYEIKGMNLRSDDAVLFTDRVEAEASVTVMNAEEPYLRTTERADVLLGGEHYQELAVKALRLIIQNGEFRGTFNLMTSICEQWSLPCEVRAAEEFVVFWGLVTKAREGGQNVYRPTDFGRSVLAEIESRTAGGELSGGGESSVQ